MRLDMEDLAEFAAFDQSHQLVHGRKKPLTGTDPEHDLGRAAGLDGARRFGLFQGQRLFAKDRLSRRRDGDDLLAMQRMRRRQHDRLNVAISEHRLDPANEFEPMLCRKVAMLVRIAADRARKTQPFAVALDRLDEGLAPPAETDDRGIDHRLAPAAPNSVGGGAEMLVEEAKDLVPAVDRLVDPVIRAIVSEESVAGSVIAVEFVVLAEPLQFGLVAVDLIGRRV